MWSLLAVLLPCRRFVPSEQKADDQAVPWTQALSEKITAKAGSGLMNYYLVSRTGKRAIELLQPLAADVG